jgi:hypothetical protein
MSEPDYIVYYFLLLPHIQKQNQLLFVIRSQNITNIARFIRHLLLCHIKIIF